MRDARWAPRGAGRAGGVGAARRRVRGSAVVAHGRRRSPAGAAVGGTGECGAQQKPAMPIQADSFSAAPLRWIVASMSP